MKSHARDQLKLLQVIYEDACSKCTADVFDNRDLETFEARIEQEGLSFVTITLPQMAKDLDRSLAQGRIDSTMFRAFRKFGTIPALLRGMFSQLFDTETGRLLNEDPQQLDVSVVEAIRQTCRAFVKLELPCAPARVTKALSGFVQTEHDLSSFAVDEPAAAKLAAVSHHLWAICLAGFDPTDITLQHGPGATADKRTGNRKYVWEQWYERVESYFPFLGNAYSVSAAGEKEFDKVSFISEREELPVKVTPVPKTMKGPRIIAIEPCSMQYAQQGLQKWLYARIEGSAISGGHVNFTDQSINQQLAMVSSVDKKYATLDLSDASDRVPLSLAKLMIESATGRDYGSEELWGAIDSCRSRYAKLPTGQKVGPLHKFASMGSALCFPIEAMYFYTICVVALLDSRGIPVTRENAIRMAREVYVYGDDLVVPTEDAVAIVEHLAKYNCKVNLDKSFWSGSFRESCGVDAFLGSDVTPVYVRRLHPYNRREHDVLISLVETRNAFYKKGFWQTARYLDRIVERHLGSLPYVSESASVLGKFTFLGGKTAERWNSRYQRFEVKGWVPSPAYRTDELSDYSALQKSLSALAKQDTESLVPEDRDPLHLQRTARYGVATLKRRWAPIQ